MIDDDFVNSNSEESVPSIATVTVTVTSVNDAPIANSDTLGPFPEDTQSTLLVLANDKAGPANETEAIFVNAVVTGPSHGTIVKSADEKSFRYTPAANYFGSDSFTYTIRDAIGAVSAPATVDLTIVNVNDAPTTVNDPKTVSEDSVDNVIDVMLNDSVGPANEIPVDSISLLSVGTPSQGGTAVIDAVNQVVKYTPAANFFGTETFTYTIQDTGGREATATVTVTVTNVNDDPTANDDTFNNIQEDSTTNTLDVLVNDSILPDVGETLTITAVNKTDGTTPGTTDQGGTVSIVSGKVNYVPAANFFGQDKFQYTISDGTSTDTAIVTVNVLSVNDAPIAVNDNLFADERLDAADPANGIAGAGERQSGTGQ